MVSSERQQKYLGLIKRGDIAGLIREIYRSGDAGLIREIYRSGDAPGQCNLGPFSVGMTMYLESLKYYVGEMVYCDTEFVGIKRAVWIACTGRFQQCMTGGLDTDNYAEWELCSDDPDDIVVLRRESILVAKQWNNAIPRVNSHSATS